MVNILDKLAAKQGDELKSANWYKSAVASITDRITAGKLMKDGKLTPVPNAGVLNLFTYDPKYKKTLPYYDIFPLVLPIERIKGGFAGLNFHYLPPLLRLRLLETLQIYATNNKLDTTTTFDVSWKRVKNMPLVAPTVKKYLYSHIVSNFLKITLDQAAIACYLPVQRFQKQNESVVYRQSRAQLPRRNRY